jgi:transcriptional regulator with XRE-family HTH domain
LRSHFYAICTNADIKKILCQFTIDSVRKSAYNDIWKEVIHLLQDNLKKLREERGLTKRELCEKAGISERAYLTYEFGEREPKIGVIQKLADFYNISTDCMLGRQTADAPTSPLQQLIDKFQLTKDQAALLVAYLNMNESDRENLIRCIKVLARGIQ